MPPLFASVELGEKIFTSPPGVIHLKLIATVTSVDSLVSAGVQDVTEVTTNWEALSEDITATPGEEAFVRLATSKGATDSELQRAASLLAAFRLIWTKNSRPKSISKTIKRISNGKIIANSTAAAPLLSKSVALFKPFLNMLHLMIYEVKHVY
jgi:hypothetical protein